MTASTYPRGLVLPSAPFAEALWKMVNAKATTIGQEAACKQLGVPIRQLRAWTAGEYETVNYKVVDRILVGTPLHWWDIWDEADYPEVHARLAS